MALVVKDRVKESSTTSGTGTLTLAGAVTGFQAFSAALSNGDTTYYAIAESSTGAWEVGLGTYTTSGTTLARTTVLDSSNSGSAINLSGAGADVFITQPADKAAYFDASGDLFLNQDPTSALQSATKQYVDSIAAAGIHYHDPVRVEREGNLTATYNNGTAGVGATLTNSGTQAALVIDGVTLNSADRVLVYEQTDQTQNGIYTVTNTGSASTNWVLTRATDADSYGPSDPDSLGQGDAFFVQEGAAGAGETYVMNTEGTITFGTTNITFAQFSSAQIYSAGDGLTLTGVTFAAGAGTGVTVNANDIAIGQDVGTSSNVTFNTVNADLTGNVTGNVTGNASTASALQTARNIALTGAVTGSTSFDGSGNVSIATTATPDPTITLGGDLSGSATLTNLGNATLTATINANSVALGTDTTGNYVGSGATSGNGISGSVGSEGGTFTVTSNATNLNTGSTTVFRDASGNFSAGTITAALSGNATTATSAAALTTARNIAVSGAVTGNANFDGSGNITISTTATSDPTITLGGDLSGSATLTNLGNATLTATINANSVALGTDTTGSYVQQGATSGNGISGSVNSEAGTFTVTSNATNANTGNTIVYRDASGNFSAGTITANLTGTASNAGTLDSLDSSQFLRSDATDTATSAIYFSGGLSAEAATKDDITTRTASGFWQTGTATTAEGWPVTSNTDYHLLSSTHSNGSNYYSMQFSGSFYNSNDIYYRSTNGGGSTAWAKLWHSANDGSGSGLDADTVDGNHASAFATAAQGTTADAALPKAGGTMTGALTFGDNVKATFGASADLEIYHDGSNSYVSDQGTGDLYLQGANNIILENSTNGENFLYGTANGQVAIYYDNAIKLATTATGINVTGTAEVDTLKFSDNSTQTSAGASTGKAIAMAIVFG